MRIVLFLALVLSLVVHADDTDSLTESSDKAYLGLVKMIAECAKNPDCEKSIEESKSLHDLIKNLSGEKNIIEAKICWVVLGGECCYSDLVHQEPALCCAASVDECNKW